MSDKTIIIKILDTHELIEDACALLYKEYIETGSWIFSDDNPSELKVITKDNRKLLVDRITPHAIWFGAFDDDKVIGCIRIFKATKNIPLEIETYLTAKEIVKQYIEVNKPNIYEGSRACVDPEYKGKNILAMLYSNMLEFCQKEKASIFGSASNGYARSVLRRIEWPCKKEDAFKFEESDPAPVSFYLANDSDISNMIKNVKLLESTRNKKTFNILDALKMVAPIFPAPIYWHDTQGTVLGVNARGLKGMGKSIEEVLGKTPYDFYEKETADHIWQNSVQVIKNGETLTQEEYAYDASGKCIGTYLAIKAPLYDEDGQVLGVLGTSIDITAEKEAEKTLIMAKEAAEAANQAKTEFVQNMQHDIRTPSSGLWGVLDFLAKSEEDKNKKEALEMAVTASKRLLDLCNDAVDFGNLDDNTRPTTRKELDIRKVAKSVIELNLPAAFAKDLVIHFKVDPSVPTHVVSDEFRLSRILINLLGNSIKFSHEGEINLKFRAKLNEEDPRHGVLIIEIKDMGIGIARDKIDNIFEKFTRGVASNTNKYPGTGLGLYVVKTFVDDLDGDLFVDSNEGDGAYFKISIPFKILWEDVKKLGLAIDEYFESPFRKKAEEEPDSKSNASKASIENTPFSHELLIIEDDKTCLFAEKNLLSGYTNKIDSAENVADALKKLAAKRYDLVISDLGLPDGSGNDIVAKIKASPESPNYKTPFVAMTAHQDAEKHKRAMDAGFTATNTKPLGTDKAVELLKTYPAQGAEAEQEEDGLVIIDLALGMQRIGAKTEDAAIEALGILYETLQEDIPALKEAEKNNDIERAREVLHKIRGGLFYSGTPRLEETFKTLHDEVKCTPELNKIDYLFDLAYAETRLFSDAFKKLVGNNK